METTEKVRTILKALGYTPSELAKDTGISRYKAKRILNDNRYELKSNDFIAFHRATGITMNTLYRNRKGRTV